MPLDSRLRGNDDTWRLFISTALTTMDQHEPIARTIARHRIIRMLVVYRAYVVMQTLMFSLAWLKHGTFKSYSLLGLLGYDGMIRYQADHFGTDVPRYGGWGYWIPFLILMPPFLLSPILLAHLSRLSHRRYTRSITLLKAIPLCLMSMAVVCCLLSFHRGHLWKIIAQTQDGIMVNRGLLVSPSNPTYPILILLTIYLLLVWSMRFWLPSDSENRWLDQLKVFWKAVLLILAAIFFITAYRKQTLSGTWRLSFYDSGLRSSYLLMILSLLWVQIYMTCTLFMLPTHISAKRVLAQARYVGSGLYYPTGKMKLGLILLNIPIQMIVFFVLLYTIRSMLFMTGRFLSDSWYVVLLAMLVSSPSLIGLMIASWRFTSKLKPVPKTGMDCIHCRYDLTGSLAAGSRQCPECGQSIPGYQQRYQNIPQT